MFSTVKIVLSVRHNRMHSKKQFKMSWTVECNSVSARKLACTCTRFLEHDGSLCCEVLLIQIKSAPNLQQFERSTKAFNTSVLNLTQTKTQKSKKKQKEVADFVVILHVSLHYTRVLHVWLHSSVGRALHWYFTEVMGLNPVEALIFSGFFFPIG